MFKPAHLVLFAAFIVLLFNSGSRMAIGLLLHPMVTDLGWTRTTLSSAVTAFMIVSACALPFAGRLVDRFGPLQVLLTGILVSGAGIACMGFIHTPLQALVIYGIVFALGSAATSVTPIGVLVARWFPQRIGLANSIAISGMGVGQLLIIALLAAHLTRIGWRGSFVAVGVATIVVVTPLLWWTGRMVAAAGPGECAGSAAKAPAVDDARTLSTVLRSSRIWVVFVLYAICGYQDFFVATHVVAFALDEGISGLLAGNMLALMGLAGLVGVLCSGVLNDRYGPVIPTAICFLIRIGIFAALAVNRDQSVIVAAALLYGMTFWVTAPLAVVFARRYCGLALLGTVSGLITMVHHISGGAGAFVGAWVFDASGSYDRALDGLLILSVIGLGLSAFTRKSASER